MTKLRQNLVANFFQDRKEPLVIVIIIIIVIIVSISISIITNIIISIINDYN